MDRGRGRMDTETVKVIVDKALAAAQTCVFGFQGGEPTLAGLPFFDDAPYACVAAVSAFGMA